jgi:CheY-like chemotaxis protein
MLKPKILLVDDCPINLLAISCVLDRANFCCIKANCALEAFEMISDRSFALVLMDIEMPEINGFEATTFLRQLNSDYYRDLPIIAITAHNNPEVIRKAKHSQMNDVISKPFDPEILISKINELILNQNVIVN